MHKKKSLSARPRIIILSFSLSLLIVVTSNPTNHSQVEKTTLAGKSYASGNVQILNNQVSGTHLQRPFFLSQIHAESAWNDWGQNNPPLIVALVDTGIDLSHPDLRSILVPGINLLQRELPPNDDNGHGTNVAGVLRAIVKGRTSTRAQIMPIKTMGSNGEGSIDKLNEGIRYAVDYGAKVVVLSEGVNQFSPETLNAVQYAEDHDVLIVAATGNNGTVVKYPAAYPTVMAVGGASKDGTVIAKSNWGPEVDVIAPWYVYTTQMGGGYKFSEGTSMAAPQVAGLAVLIWSKYPYMKAYQIRDLIRQTADHFNQDGWDPHAGFGLIRADQALTQPYQEDMYANNTTKSSAAPFSYSKSIDSEFQGQNPKWFYSDVPYDGTIQFSMQTDNADASMFRVVYDNEDDSNGTIYPFINQNAEVPVHKGRNYIKLQSVDNQNGVVPFHLTTQFQIYSNPFGDTDRMYKAYVLPLRNQEVTGTFDRKDAKDWFMVPVNQSGILHVKVTTDTPRIDLSLKVRKVNEKQVLVDQMGEGETESATLRVFPDDYYVKIQNVISEHPYPVTGEYKFAIDFTPKLLDPNEPNKHPYEATSMVLNTDYPGVLDTDSQMHWYSFHVNKQSVAHIRLKDISPEQQITLELFDSNLQFLGTKQNSGKPSMDVDRDLTAGTYYMKLSLVQGNPNQLYNLRVFTEADKN
ncbi:Serine protease, subtilisin family [Paenibacillus sp. yr247]|uniref:S8 family peptidase n=1 Tax=Paenibacillus sp. yr247 TaxID=1761880 RepID=UPI0008813D50|nr:S8 family serine peptidase [Paenibacillus sp. yr247]SDN92439.1 Serine protease, subtilisin family [Paenibacillus sp. yr247]